MSGFYENLTGDSYEAPEIERSQTPFANRPDTTKPYVNNNQASKEAMKVTQKDLSYYAFNRYALSHPVRDSFEQSVNISFGEVVTGHNWNDLKSRYMALYKNMMGA